MRRGWIWAAALHGCSLAVSQEVEPPRCQRSAQCEVLNGVDGVARESRRRWYCPPGPAGLRVCTLGDLDEDGDRESPDALAGGTDCDDTDPRRGRRQVEAPDGIDNDCDGVIDEGVWRDGAAVALGAAPTPVVTFAGSVRSDGSAAVAMTSGDNHGALARVDGGALRVAPVTYRSVYLDFSIPREAPGRCSYPDVASGAACDLGDLAAVEASPSQWFSASVNTVGCASGQLRLGWFSDADFAVVLDARPGGRGSNVGFGVDVGPESHCGGFTRMPPVRGAARPSIAALPAEAGQASRGLVTWHARAANAVACGAPAKVETLGVWLASGPDERGDSRSWVMATDDGRPQVLGVTEGGGRVATTAMGEGGFVVAYGRQGGTIAVQVVAGFAVPAGSASVALDVSRSVFVLATSATAPIDGVALAPGATREGRPELGVAWREGCGPGGALRFARVRFDPTDPARSEASAPVTLAASGAEVPAIAYVEDGMRVRGTRVGERTLGERDDGGWVIAWIDHAEGGLRARAQRVSELDGALLPATSEGTAPEAAVEIAALSGGSAGITLGRGDGSGGALRYLLHEGGAARWLGGGLMPRSGR
jgi:hypothetical protein